MPNPDSAPESTHERAERIAKRYGEKVLCEYKEAEGKTDSLLSRCRAALRRIENSRYSALILWVGGFLGAIIGAWLGFASTHSLLISLVSAGGGGVIGAVIFACLWTGFVDGWTHRD